MASGLPLDRRLPQVTPEPVAEKKHSNEAGDANVVAGVPQLLDYREHSGDGKEQRDEPDGEDGFRDAAVFLDEDVMEVAAVGVEHPSHARTDCRLSTKPLLHDDE